MLRKFDKLLKATLTLFGVGAVLAACSSEPALLRSQTEDAQDKAQVSALKNTKKQLDQLARLSPNIQKTRSAAPAPLATKTVAKSTTLSRPTVAPHSAPSGHPRPLITGRGYAQVSNQPGKTLNTKRLMALRAARLEALRDLTEQIHGLRLNSDTTIRDAIVQNDTIRAQVAGEIRGARTARITPKDHDSFEVVLELAPSIVAYILSVARGRI